MGNCFSNENSTDSTEEERDQQKKIEKILKADEKNIKGDIKLLLLGAGDTGKSTILKQMKILHAGGFTNEERNDFRRFICSNIVQAIRSIIVAAQSFGYSLTPEEESICSNLMSLEAFSFEHIPVEYNKQYKAISSTTWYKQALQRNSEFNFNDSALYFLERVDRFTGQDFLPTDEDILQVKVKSVGISELHFALGKGARIRMIDVGGQRSERKKWIHAFQDITGLIFLAALSEYDLFLSEDVKVNRFEESLVLFEQTVNSKWFVNSNVILFLNKSDLFKVKVAEKDFEYGDFKANRDYDAAIGFIKSKFRSLNHDSKKQIYIHVTCATDTSNIKFVFSSVQDMIFSKAMDNSGL